MKFGDRYIRSARVFWVAQRLRSAEQTLMKTRASTSWTLVAALVTAALAIASAAALAAVTVYENDFSSRAEYRAVVNSGGGKGCDRNYREKSEAMIASLRRGPATCSFRAPVAGDRELPNHEVRLDSKILKRTDRSVRGGAFVELSVRSGGGGTGYALRVLPKRQRFVLRRGPAGSGFPVQGKSDAINPINERNQLRLIATGAEIRALVNGEQVAKLSDPDPGEVDGRKMRFAIGNQKDKRGKVVGTFRQVALAVPNP